MRLSSIFLLAAGCLHAAGGLRPVPLADVDIHDDFWSPRIETNRTVSIQHCFREFESTGRFDSPRLIEAAAYMLAKRKDPELQAYVEKLIDREIAGVERRLSNPDQVVRVSGYYFEAAVAWYRATGERRMYDTALRAIDAIDASYGPGKKTYIAGHEGLEIGLLAMYRETGEPRYLKLAQFFLDERGKDDYPRTGEYARDRTYDQDQAPVVQQTEAVGHAVRATYLYIPLAEITALTDSPVYRRALDLIWQDAAYRKTYVTGSIGSIRFHEQFGAAYELPNLSGWSETCASYGNFVWNNRMFLASGESRYVDQMERVLYNGFLDGVSLKGDRFFYQNPLSSYGNYERFTWIDTPCCPPNVVRLMASLASYLYAQDDRDIYVNLFAGSSARVHGVTIRQETRYPWQGADHITVDPPAPRTFAMYLRIPSWATTRAIDGNLYHFMETVRTLATLRVNGRPVPLTLDHGYARIEREWKAGDAIDLSLPMDIRRVAADPHVRDDEGRVAIERGPLVYCAEWPDNGGHALNLIVPDNAPLTGEFRPNLLNGVEVVTGTARRLKGSRAVPQPLVAIPYFAWANRGMGEMEVWMARRPEKARLYPTPLPAGIAKAQSSGGIEKKWTGYNDQNDDLSAVYDGEEPLNSADESNLYFRMRPAAGQPAWVEYDYSGSRRISSSEVYWVDDRRFCRLPSNWRILYRDGDAWKPVHAKGAYAVGKDRFDRIAFDPVTTTAVRIEVEPQTIHYKVGDIGPPGANFLTAATDWRELGIIEWRVK